MHAWFKTARPQIYKKRLQADSKTLEILPGCIVHTTVHKTIFLIASKWVTGLGNVLTRSLPIKRLISVGCLLYSFRCLSIGTWFLTVMLHSVANFAATRGTRGLIFPSVMTTGSLPRRAWVILWRPCPILTPRFHRSCPPSCLRSLKFKLVRSKH